MLTYLNNPEIHKICKYFFSESSSRFLLAEVQNKTQVNVENPEFNHLAVILEGRLIIEYDEFIGKTFGANEIVFIPSYSQIHIESVEKSKILLLTFEMPQDICTSKMMESLWELRSKIEYKFDSAPIVAPMKTFLDLLLMYLESGVQCAHLHDIKEKEFFLVFRWYYSKEDFVKLFYPIIGKSLNFRTQVIKNYAKVKNVAELASLMGMSRANFDLKFKEVFDETPKHWILKRKAKSVRFFMSKPNVTISDVMIQFDFDSFTQFNRFCKQHFGAPPSELIKEKDPNSLP